MSWLNRIRDAVGGTRKARDLSEDDAPADMGTARSRDTGGVPDSGALDPHSTTGTTDSDTFVGRASGDVSGDSGTTGTDVRGDATTGRTGAARDTQ